MKNLTFLLLLLSFWTSNAQKNSIYASIQNTIPIQADAFYGEDNLGYWYYSNQNVLFKKKGAEVFQYQNIALGKITRVDFQNPLRLLVFYESFNTIIALDSQCNELQKKNLSDAPIFATAIAMGASIQNSYWLLDQNTQFLGLYQYNANQYKTIGTIFAKKVKTYYSNLNYFYWIDADNEAYSCSFFGNISYLGKVPDYDKVYWTDESALLFEKNSELFLMDIKKNSIYLVENVQKSFSNLQYKNQNLAIFTNEGITNYKINIP